MRTENRVVVVGSGMMGSGIGAMAALAGRPVILADLDEGRARLGVDRAAACVRLREENGLASAQQARRALSLLEAGADVDRAVQGAALVIEAIAEDLEAKQALFQRLDAALPPDVPLCSNTSGLRITEIAALCRHPERTMTTHFWLPAHLVPLVEVVMGAQTREETARQMMAELKRWGKSPVLVRKDLPGQLANRIFQAMIREAVAIVADGLACAEDVDTAISCGMAMRFPEWGPLMHLDAIGLQLGLSVQDAVLPGICADRRANDYLRALVEQGKLGASAGEGFYDWRSRDIRQAMEKRDQFIIEAVKLKERLDGTG